MADEVESRKLWDLIAKIVTKHRSERRISPAWIATEALADLDPKRKTTPLIYLGCHMHLRQIARSLCRTQFEGDKRSASQHEMFPELQWRYPSARSAEQDEPEYVRLEFLTTEDLAYNIERLRREGEAKIEHADALAAYASKKGRRNAA